VSQIAAGKSQLNFRVTDNARALLEKLCKLYGDRAGLDRPFSQAETIDKLIRDAAAKEGIKGKGK
jgi:uncharacterized protein (DUF1778 family)